MPVVATQILINHIGYDTKGPKRAVVQSSSPLPENLSFSVIYNSGQQVFEGTAHESGDVPGWKGRFFSVLEFDEFAMKGRFRIRVLLDEKEIISDIFRIGDGVVFNTVSMPVFRYFNGMRSYIDDRFIAFIDKPEKHKDVSGGWDDASGDTGKYLSHLSYADYFNPQHTPMVVWSILKSLDVNEHGFARHAREMREEAAWGADFLMRMYDVDGYFYTNVFDRWGMGSERQICAYKFMSGDLNANYQAAFREGAGTAIAALARAARMELRGTYAPNLYLKTAENAFAHLLENNTKYLNNGRENIIDDYCALLAAVELFRATGGDLYKQESERRARALVSKQHPDGWFRSEDGSERPFYHGVDEGMVILSLVEYMATFGIGEPFLAATRKAAIFYVAISTDTFNPFSYVKQYSSACDNGTYAEPKMSFFMPHKNETGYWWQGENARIGSMATALFAAASLLGPRLKISPDELAEYGTSQINWVLGCNPFNLCMVCSYGHKDYPDLEGAASRYARTNVEGGICNGITAKDSDEEDLDWMAGDDRNPSMAVNWRWAEQWLPHNSWFLLALAMQDAWRRGRQ